MMRCEKIFSSFIIKSTMLVLFLFAPDLIAYAQSQTFENQGVFDDAKILAGYAEEYANESKETLIGRINDDAINFYQIAAIDVFKQRFALTIVGREKIRVEQDLIRRINRTNSALKLRSCTPYALWIATNILTQWFRRSSLNLIITT